MYLCTYYVHMYVRRSNVQYESRYHTVCMVDHKMCSRVCLWRLTLSTGWPAIGAHTLASIRSYTGASIGTA